MSRQNRRGTLVVPAETGWVVKRCAADPTSGSLRGADATSGSLRIADSLLCVGSPRNLIYPTEVHPDPALISLVTGKAFLLPWHPR
jgi:hypothetical protein